MDANIKIGDLNLPRDRAGGGVCKQRFFLVEGEKIRVKSGIAGKWSRTLYPSVKKKLPRRGK